MSKYLPIGSIVQIKNKKEKYIILGTNIISNKKKYDYIAAYYPFGFVIEINCINFNNADISSICFLGDINYKED